MPPAGGRRLCLHGVVDDLELRPPTVGDGAALARLAREAGDLDVNSSYAYVLWCRDFATTSVIAVTDDRPVGFVTGYRRPLEPSALFVWQVAVDPAHRGARVARRMLDALVDRVEPAHVEATVTADNAASQALFTSFARRRGVDVARSPLFERADFPEPHDAEELLRIGPLI